MREVKYTTVPNCTDLCLFLPQARYIYLQRTFSAYFIIIEYSQIHILYTAVLRFSRQVPLWSTEPIFRDGKLVGYLRRGEYGYALGKSIGQG